MDTSKDAPIPTLDFLRQLARRDDWPPKGYARLIRPDGSFTTEQVSWTSPYPCPRPCATLVLGEPVKPADATTLASTLDLRRAVATTLGSASSTVRALAQRNVFLIESPLPARLDAIAAANGIAEPERGDRDGVVFLRQELPGDVDWPGMSFAVALAQSQRHKVVAIVTSHEKTDVVSAACQLAKSTLAADAAQLVREHERIWEKFWSASGIELAEPFLSAVWYRNLYFMRCMSRPGTSGRSLREPGARHAAALARRSHDQL